MNSKAKEMQENFEKRVDTLNDEHILEAQTMLREFESAQAFLKKQIASQAKQYD
jgi:hypothetical protein